MKAVDAEYTIYDNKSVSSNLPATLDNVSFLRHPKAELSPVYLAEIKEDIALDIELGLKSQYDMDQKKILKNDIDELTKSNEYHQVSKHMLEELFHIGELRLRCFPHNLKEAVVQSLKGAWIPILLAGVTIILTMFTVHFINCSNAAEAVHKSGASLITFFAGIAFLIGAIFGLALTGASMFGGAFGSREFKYDFIDVKLILEGTRNTSVTIPRMAKLKMKEAKDSGLFEDFTIAHPQFMIEHKEYHPHFNVDPVILGVTEDNRMYMVCWWDLKKDIDRAKTDLKRFKKFKVV